MEDGSTPIVITAKNLPKGFEHEAGMHRIQRVPPTEQRGRVHTSTVAVAILDEGRSAPPSLHVSDLHKRWHSGTGAGGQHRNKTQNCLELTHLPTGLVATSQSERSQHQNKETALKILQARLLKLELAKRAEERAKIKGKHIAAGWGNQIRSYVLHPYKMVKDHRTDYQKGNAEAVLDGELDDFITAYLRSAVDKDE